MKKLVTKILLIVMCIGFGPIQVLAENVEVGVKIQGVQAIDVVTSISSDILVDLTAKQSYPTYLTVLNNGTSPVEMSITDISAVDTAPNNFQEFNPEYNELANLGVKETKEKIAFGISEGSTYDSKTIYPENSNDYKPVSLGVVPSSTEGGGGVTYPDLFERNNSGDYLNVPYQYAGNQGLFLDQFAGPYENGKEPGQRLYQLNVQTGYAWETNQLLKYNIIMIAELPQETMPLSAVYSNAAIGVEEMRISKGVSANYNMLFQLDVSLNSTATNLLDVSDIELQIGNINYSPRHTTSIQDGIKYELQYRIDGFFSNTSTEHTEYIPLTVIFRNKQGKVIDTFSQIYPYQVLNLIKNN